MSTHAPTSPEEKHSNVMAPPSGQGVVLNAAFAGARRVPEPINEPINSYAPGTPQRAELKARLKSMAAEKIEIPVIIGGREIRTGNVHSVVMPHDHAHVLASTISLVPSTCSRRSPRPPPRAANGPHGRGKIAPRCCC